MRRASGFSLLEVVIASGVLAVGLLAVAALQLKALEVRRGLQEVRALVTVAERELVRRLAVLPSASAECTEFPSASPLVTSCRVYSESCKETAVPCGGSALDRATRLSVIVHGKGQRHLTLSTLKASFPP